MDDGRQELALMLALLRKHRIEQQVSFPQQEAFVNDPSQFLAAQCTRRAGKSNALALRFYNTMMKHSGSLCPYIALTRESSKNTMWSVLQDQNEKLGWNATFTESDLSMRLSNGSRLQLFGADMKNFVRRLRGIKTPGAAVDEAQEFDAAHLANLIDNILTPATADYVDSWIALTGTPGAIPRGYFYDVTQQKKFGYSVHSWSLYDNPFMPDARGFVSKLKEKMQWPEDHPTLMREYYGKWVLDLESLLIKYNEGINHYHELPNVKWNYILGVDLGHRDADALALLGWSESLPDIYLIEEQITRGQDITELSTQIEAMCRRYDIAKIVMDEGALGKKIAEEIRRRKHIPVQPADKMRKMENVAFLNDYLRQGKFKAKRDSRFAKDSELVQIDWEKSSPDRIVVKSGFHSDIIDSVLYAFKESPAFTFSPIKEGPKPYSKEWFEKEVSDMEEAAVEHFTALERNQSEDDQWGW